MPLDADLGWHLKYGEYFYTHLTPLRDNIYSTMMTGYKWPNSSWITDITSYTAYQIGGFQSLSFLSALTVTATFFFIAKAFKLTFLKQAIFFPILLFLLEPVNNVSFRGQQLSLLFLAILLFLLNSFNKSVFSKKIKRAYFIPLLFLIWVNTHGEYLLGIGVMGIWILGKMIESIILYRFRNINDEKTSLPNRSLKNVFYDFRFWITIMIFSLIATLIDPFGIAIYHEALTHIGNPNLKDVVEYLPFKEFSLDWRNIFLTGSLLLFGVMLLVLNGKFIKTIPNILVVFCLFIFALSIKRFAWPFYYTTPAVLGAILEFDRRNNLWSRTVGVGIIIFSFTLLFLNRNPISVLGKMNWNIYCNSYIDCSPSSAEFLKKTKIKKPLWTNYNWGGWIIWNYPTIKPSIDGRMHLWRDKTGYSAFEEYYPLEQNLKDIDKSGYNTVYAWRAKPIITRLNELVREGKWRYLYIDSSAVIAERISFQ